MALAYAATQTTKAIHILLPQMAANSTWFYI